MAISYDMPDYSVGHYQDQGAIRTCARPWKMVHDQKPDKAVLCLHGYSGYPGELYRPGTDLFEAGFDVFAVRYPGHGTCSADFQASDMEDWLGTAYDACKELCSRYEEVSLVGHSMGGAIAVLLASAFAIKRMVLFSPALLLPMMSMSKLRFAKIVKRGKPVPVPWKQDLGYHFACEMADDDDAYLGSQYWSWLYIDQLISLEKLRKMAVASLEHMTTDTLVIVGGKDPTVPQQVADLVIKESKGRCEKLLLDNGTHLIPYDKDIPTRDIALAECVSWLSNGN